jgi:hypothetical protein
MAAGARPIDTGLATHSATEIAFELPPGARQVAAAVSLDALVGDRGCVQCQVRTDSEDGSQILWDSGFLQGKDGLRATGKLAIDGAKRMVLATLFAHDGRPEGADPLDIRDEVIWVEPLIELAASNRAAELKAVALLAGASDWTLAGDDWQRSRVESRWNAPASQWDSVLVLPQHAEVRLTRRVSVTRASDIVELLTVCPMDLDDHDFRLLVNGEVLPWENNADRNQIRQWTLRYSRTRARDGEQETNFSERLAYWWDLSRFRGQKVDVELIVRGKNERNEIAWRDLCVRSAIGNLPDDGKPLPPDVRLTALEPIAADPRVLRAMQSAGARQPGLRFLGQAADEGYLLPRDSRVSFDLKP